MALMEIIRGDIVYTAYADEAITAGNLVKASGSDDVVSSSGVSSFGKGDIHVSLCNASGDNLLCSGIALEDIASGSYGSIATRGIYILRSAGEIDPGQTVAFANSTDPDEVTASTTSGTIIGRALTGASAADKYLVVLLDVAGG